MSEPRLVRGLLRGLTVLRALNETNYATAMELSKRTGLPRSTVYRLLDTLMAAGYVGIGARKETYQLTILVRALSDGFNDEAWVTVRYFRTAVLSAQRLYRAVKDESGWVSLGQIVRMAPASDPPWR